TPGNWPDHLHIGGVHLEMTRNANRPPQFASGEPSGTAHSAHSWHPPIRSRVWQLTVFPSAEVYCAATPTECMPFLGIAVSSITNTASLPPTSSSAWLSSSVSTGLASQTPAAMK